MTAKPIAIETARLRLRPFGADGVEPHIAMMQNEDIARFLTTNGKPQARGVEWRSAATLIGHWELRGFGFFSVYEKSSGAWVGRVGPWMPDGWPGLEVGWAIDHAYWGKGYAGEAAIASMKWVFREFPEWARIISVIDPGNNNSQQVARKIGETQTGDVFDYHGMALDIWAAERDPWLAKFG